MKIVIVGCGKVGNNLVRVLSREGHEVSVIDNHPEKLKGIVADYDVMGIAGSGMDHEVLEEAGVPEADLFIAITGNDELNLLLCLLGRKLGAAQTIARVRSPEYSAVLNHLQSDLGVSMIINPEMAAATEIYRSLSLPPTVSAESFSNGSCEIYTMRIPAGSVLDGMPLRDIPSRLKADILVCIVERDNEVIIPAGDFVLKEKDLISITGPHHASRAFFKRIGIKSSPVHNVMAIGAGKICFYLAQMLAKTNISLTMVENDPAVCEKMAGLFPDATIILGNGSDQEMLVEEGLEDMDAFVSLTGIDEENIILSLYIQQLMNIKTITKINRIKFDEMLAGLNLDTIVNPKKLTADSIVRYARAAEGGLGSNVETVHHLAQDRVEALEFHIRKPGRICNVPLMNLNLKKGTLCALIIRDGKAILPRGSDSLKVGDQVIVVTTEEGLCSLDDILDEDSL